MRLLPGSVLFALSALSVGQAAHAELRAAGAAEIVEAAQTCMTAVSASGVDKASLSARGWSAATASKDGKPMSMPMPIYGKGSVMMMLGSGGSPTCIVTARVRKVDDFRLVRDELAKLIAAKPVGEMNGGPLWLLPGGKAVQFATTGNRDKPSVRIAVVGSSGGRN